MPEGRSDHGQENRISKNPAGLETAGETEPGRRAGKRRQMGVKPGAAAAEVGRSFVTGAASQLTSERERCSSAMPFDRRVGWSADCASPISRDYDLVHTATRAPRVIVVIAHAASAP
jgi:hypothetical protein